MLYEELVDQIRKAVKNNTLSFFVGAGVSRCSGLPGWSDLITKMCNQMGIERSGKISFEECLKYAQFFYDSEGEEEYLKFVRKEIAKQNAEPNEIHRLMLSFRPASFLTTNYDNLIEKAAAQECLSYTCVAKDSDVAGINGNNFILKVHGEIESNKIVLTEDDYLSYEEDFRLVSTVLRSVFATNTVIIIGYGITDYNIKLIMDWVKKATKKEFKPIFVYSEKSPLPHTELKYYETRGLKVVQLCKICTEEELMGFDENDWTPRYIKILSYFSKMIKPKTIGQTDDESFEILYNRLEPLDKLMLLRKRDVKVRLEGCCSLDDDVVIPAKKELFNKFSVYNSLYNEKKSRLITREEQKKYNLIRRVFHKAGITRILFDSKDIKIEYHQNAFVDKVCVSYDYLYMEQYCKQDYKIISSRYKKAFYLTRLHRFNEAYRLFETLVKESFKDKDYIHYYLSAVNYNTIGKLLTEHPGLSDKTSIPSQKQERSFYEYENEQLFDTLPQEFKTEYKSLRDLCSSEALSRYGYEALYETQNLKNSLSKHEISLTSLGAKAVGKLNDYLHFIIGNGLCLDIYQSYKTSVSSLMEGIILKQVDQHRASLVELGFLKKLERPLLFDQFDLYCLIHFCNVDDLDEMLKRCSCETIEFKDDNSVEETICNILGYAERILKNKDLGPVHNAVLFEVKSCLVLAKYICLSNRTIEKLCYVAFEYIKQGNTISIGHIDRFLDSQVRKRGVISKKLADILRKELITYLDERIRNGLSCDDCFYRNRVHFANLVNYLDKLGKNNLPAYISEKVDLIVSNQIDYMLREVVEYYLRFVYLEVKQRVLKRIRWLLEQSFDFELMSLLVEVDQKEASIFSYQLRAFLDSKLSKEEKNANYGIMSLLEENLEEYFFYLGCWCQANIFDKQDFYLYTRTSKLFSFLLESEKFDFSKFEVKWLLRYPWKYFRRAINETCVLRAISKKIVEVIKRKKIKPDEKEILIDILCDCIDEKA